MTKPKQNTQITEYMKKVYDGKHRHFTYFHEKERHIAVVYTFNLTTNTGFYTASIWRYQKDKALKYPWNKKTHRDTAIQRFEKCKPVPFHLVFTNPHKDFHDKLRQVIRETIMKMGVKGARLSNDTMSSEFLNDDIVINDVEESDEIENIDEKMAVMLDLIPYPTRASTRNKLKELKSKKRKTTLTDSLVEAMH